MMLLRCWVDLEGAETMTQVIGKGMSLIACTIWFEISVKSPEGEVEDEGSNDGSEPKRKSKKVCD